MISFLFLNKKSWDQFGTAQRTVFVLVAFWVSIMHILRSLPKEIPKENTSLIFQSPTVSLIFSQSSFVCRQPFREGSTIYGGSISFHFSYHPRISSTMRRRPPGIPLPGSLKSPLCLIWVYCQRNISVFSLPSSPFWQEYSAAAVLASPELMQISVCVCDQRAD